MRLLLLFAVTLVTGLSCIAQVDQQSELENINHSIEALRSKREITKADPVQHQKALDEGWYDGLAASLKVLFDKKRVLLKEQTGKTFISYEEIETYPADKKQALLDSDSHIVEQK